MMASHLVSLLVFSSLVSVVFAFLQRDDDRERLRFGLRIFLGFVLSTLIIGWLMYPWPR
jgi:prepilin signal peptidase PulO-like enzyme (type II secretory pathway)